MVAVVCETRGHWPVNPEKCYLLLREVDTFLMDPYFVGDAELRKKGSTSGGSRYLFVPLTI